MTDMIFEAAGLEELTRDIRRAAVSLDVRQARYLVDMYYTFQEHRIALNAQARSMEQDEEPHESMTFFGTQMDMLEKQAQQVLDYWSREQPLGKWARAQKGVGPVLAAGLLAHIDIEIAVTASHVWRFAGLDPSVEWGKGEKRPWNADLKLLAWKLGESFMKVSGYKDAFYGRIYRERKQYEIARNGKVLEVPTGVAIVCGQEKEPTIGHFVMDGEGVTAYQIADTWFYGGNAQSAHDMLAKKRIGKDTIAYKAYSQGKIPDAQILARAKRYAVKLFLAHYVETGRKLAGLEVPKPYPITYLGHTDIIPPPPGA